MPKQNTSEGASVSVDWRSKYAEIITRKGFYVSA